MAVIIMSSSSSGCTCGIYAVDDLSVWTCMFFFFRLNSPIFIIIVFIKMKENTLEIIHLFRQQTNNKKKVVKDKKQLYPDTLYQYGLFTSMVYYKHAFILSYILLQ